MRTAAFVRIAPALLALLAFGVTGGCGTPDPADAPEPQEASEPQPASDASGVLTIGTITDSPSKIQRVFQPFADLVAARLAEHGIGRAAVRSAPTIRAMAQLLRDGAVDVFVDSPFPMLRVAELTGAVPLVRRWKKGEAEYRSVVFVRADSGIDDPRGLAGRTIAFEDPHSTSGFLLPKGHLAGRGIQLAPADGNRAARGDIVSYVFSRDEETSIYWVLAGRVDAAALSNLDFLEYGSRHEEELRVIDQTRLVPRHVVATRPDLAPALRDALHGVLVTMHEDDAGRDVLKKFKKTAKFDDFPGGTEVYLGPVRELLRRILTDLDAE